MSLRRYAGERIGITLLGLFLAVTVAYVCFHVWAPRPNMDEWTQAQVERYHEFKHESYGDFLWRLAGRASFDPGSVKDPTGEIGDRTRVTFSIALGALAFGLGVGVSFGLAWAKRPRSVRFAGQPFVHIALALWPLSVGLWLSYWFGYRWNLLPVAAYCDFFGGTRFYCNGPGPIQWAEHLLMPWFTLGLPLAAVYTVLTRRLAIRLRKDEGEEARRRAVVAFAKRIARNVFWLMGATIFVEEIFNLPGLAEKLFVSSRFDPPLGEDILIFATLLTVGGWLVVDLVGAALSRDWRVS